MKIKIKEKRGITLVSLVVTIIVLLILSAVSVAMLTGENGLLTTARDAKIESQKADYRETIELSKVEEGINKKLNRTKINKLEGIYKILRNGEKFKKDIDDNKASMELIDNDELEPRIVIITKEGWKYTVTVDGIIEGDIPSIDLKKADVKIETEPIGWTNEDVRVVSIKIQNEEYKENKIQYSFDLKTWKDYKNTEIVITENKSMYVRLVNGLSISDRIQPVNIINIDKKDPEIKTALNSSNVTTKGFTVNIGVIDENSGLGKIIWYYKKSDATSYESEEIAYKELHSLQSGETTEVTESKTYNNLTSGTYNVYAEIYDVAGNIISANSSETPLEITLKTITGLTTANTTFTADPNGWTNGKVTVTASTSVSGYTIQTSKDAQTWTSTATQEFTENGEVYARLWDGTNAGEYSTGNVTNIDTLDPNAFTPTATSTTKSITVKANATDAEATSTSGKSGIAGYRFRLDSGTWTAYQTSGTYTWNNLTQTTNHTITVEAKDNAENTKQGTVTKGTGTVTPGTTTGAISFSTPTWSGGKASTTISTNTKYTIQYQINSTTGNWITGTSVTGRSHGDIIYARLWDGVNAGTYASITINDSTAPSVPTLEVTSGTASGYNNGWYKSNVVIKITAGTDSQSGVAKTTYTLTGKTTKAETTITSGNTITISAEGTTKVTSYTYDKAGNKSSEKALTVKIDKTAPSNISMDFTGSISLSAGSYVIKASGSDSNSGIRKYGYSTNNGSSWTQQTGASYTVSFSSSFSHSVKIRVYDNAGNYTDSSVATMNPKAVLIRQLYEKILGRAPDQSGYDNFRKIANCSDIIYSLVTSTEAKNKYGTNYTSYATAMYQGILGRTPASSETSSTATAIKKSGVAAISRNFSNSDEFRKLCTKYKLSVVPYVATANQVICTIGGRAFYKYDSNAAIIRMTYQSNSAGTWTAPVLVSTSANGVKYYTDYNKQTLSSSGSLTYNGTKYYYSSTDQWMPNVDYSSSFSLVNSTSTRYTSVGQAAKAILDSYYK